MFSGKARKVKTLCIWKSLLFSMNKCNSMWRQSWTCNHDQGRLTHPSEDQNEGIKGHSYLIHLSHPQTSVLLFLPCSGGTRNFFVGGGHRGGKMRFWGGKNPKICRKWLILAIFFFWLGGKVGGGRASDWGHLPPMPSWCRHCSLEFLKTWELKNFHVLWHPYIVEKKRG